MAIRWAAASGRDPVTERQLRAVVAEVDWGEAAEEVGFV